MLIIMLSSGLLILLLSLAVYNLGILLEQPFKKPTLSTILFKTWLARILMVIVTFWSIDLLGDYFSKDHSIFTVEVMMRMEHEVLCNFYYLNYYYPFLVLTVIDTLLLFAVFYKNKPLCIMVICCFLIFSWSTKTLMLDLSLSSFGYFVQDCAI